jgi:hypothetical protein
MNCARSPIAGKLRSKDPAALFKIAQTGIRGGIGQSQSPPKPPVAPFDKDGFNEP